MRKVFTKIICIMVAAVSALGILFAAACSDVYKSQPLKNYTSTQDKAVSNGGFVVEKGDFVYFINGQENNTAENTFGKVVRGAIMRISKSDLANRNYSSVDTVVPQIAYSGNANAGIFVYGDYVYYATPSTEKNSDGEIQNSSLAFKRTKLDGTESMKDYFVQYDNNAIEYRYVEVGGVVYLMYVATEEDLFETGSTYTNLHSVNTETGENTLLAYNVGSVIFDSKDVTNPRVFYTMSVTDFELESTTSKYNQVYTVTADATEATDYSEYFNEVYADTEDGYDPEKDPKYVNCGTLVFDGIGKIQGMMGNVTVFNHPDAVNVNRSAYTYALSSYSDGVLYYTRTTTGYSTLASLYAADMQNGILASGWNPVTSNDTAKYLIQDGSSASSYNYIYENGKLSSVLIATSNGLVKTSIDGNGEIPYTGDNDIDNEDTYYVMTDGQPEVLFFDSHNGHNYLYYSLSGGNGYSVYRICYDGAPADYHNPFGDDVSEYTPVKVLDLDATSGWYKPELIEGQLLFSAQTDNMASYPYILACDLRVRENGAATSVIMSNVQIDSLNDKYEGVSERIEEVDEEVYEHLQNALTYAFYTSDDKYIGELIQAYQDVLGYDEEYYWSKESVAIYGDFLNGKNDWSDYAADTVKVNGVDVQANKRDYYYALLGVMNESDAEGYSDLLKANYMPEWPQPEEKEAWFDTLSGGAKAGFIIGVCAGGIIIILLAAFIIRKIIKKRKSKMPVYKKKRIKVDTTDDKDIDVYSDEQNAPKEDSTKTE